MEGGATKMTPLPSSGRRRRLGGRVQVQLRNPATVARMALRCQRQQSARTIKTPPATNPAIRVALNVDVVSSSDDAAAKYERAEGVGVKIVLLFTLEYGEMRAERKEEADVRELAADADTLTVNVVVDERHRVALDARELAADADALTDV